MAKSNDILRNASIERLAVAAESAKQGFAKKQSVRIGLSGHLNMWRSVFTQSRNRLRNAKWFILVFCIWVSTFPCHVIADELEVRGQSHSKKPLIGQRYINDQDGNALEDQLEARLEKAQRDLAKAVSKKDKDKAQEKLDKFIEVQFIFTSPIKQSQLTHFERFGGNVDYIYKAASYGWNDKIPLKRLRSIAAVLDSDLVLVEESKPIQAHLDVATSNGRVRPVWAPGFAGSSNGFHGTDSITIAIVAD